jgi:hypothetical protein
MRFLAALAAAIGNALAYTWAIVTWPARALAYSFRPQGQSAIPMPPEQTDNRPVPTPAERQAQRDAVRQDLNYQYRRDTLDVVRYLAAALKGETPEVSARIPRAVRDWLPGLSRDEMQRLVRAGVAGILAHLRGVKLVSDVRPVGKIEPRRTSSVRRVNGRVYVDPIPAVDPEALTQALRP